ncbi:DUF2339 domain-containing protein, partial [Escherichia coli]|uniref:DUF2339 domain-containing protein n=1 Tax=Escherichia coli TaxID=562 RepID=UPI0027397026
PLAPPISPDDEKADETVVQKKMAEAPRAPAVAPPQNDASKPGFEEKLGTRWVVWIGGLTLALGGLFLVKYSIEAGLLGPGVRVLLGGLFA